MSAAVHSFLIQAPSTCSSAITQSHLLNDWDDAKEKEMYRRKRECEVSLGVEQSKFLGCSAGNLMAIWVFGFV